MAGKKVNKKTWDKPEYPTCAACGGELPDNINTVYFRGFAVELCAACTVLGSPELLGSFSQRELCELKKARANPRAPTTGTPDRVWAWIKSRYDVIGDPMEDDHE